MVENKLIFKNSDWKVYNFSALCYINHVAFKANSSTLTNYPHYDEEISRIGIQSTLILARSVCAARNTQFLNTTILNMKILEVKN